MNLLNLASGIVDTLWKNSLDEILRDGISKDYSLRPTSIADFLNDLVFRDMINFYPGKRGAPCHETAVFLSLSKAPPRAKWMKKTELVPLTKILPNLIQHAQGKCFHESKNILLIVDENLSMKTINEWKSNLQHIQIEDRKQILIVYVDPNGNTYDINNTCGLRPF